MINLQKLYDWLNIQLEDVQMIYDAHGNEKAYGAIKAYQAMIAISVD